MAQLNLPLTHPGSTMINDIFDVIKENGSWGCN